LRIGISAAPREGSVDYVLNRFFDEEKALVRSTIGRAVDGVKCVIDNGLVSAMNTFNPEDSPAIRREDSVSPQRPDHRGQQTE
jgi:peptidyl-tRNA hydrolase